MIGNRHKTLFGLPLFLMMVFACEKIGSEGPIPAYIYIESFNTQVSSGQGTGYQQFTDAWIYANSELVGAFQLPALIPVIEEGETRIQVRPGIILNGIASTRASYPFMKPWEVTVNLVKEEVDTLHPIVTYHDNVKFPWGINGQEGFEQSGITMDSAKGSHAMIHRQSQIVFEGLYSGHIHLEDPEHHFQVQSVDYFQRPSTGVPAFLELHYKADNSFTVGVILHTYTGDVITHPLVGVRPRDHWNKMYVNLTPVLLRYTQAVRYKVYFSGNVNTDTLSTADVYLDNIKLLHLQ